MGATEPETRVLDATKSCCERFGMAKVTIDDICEESGVSRATIYRLFPGGRDVLFEALRVRELNEFFDVLTAGADGHDDVDDLIVSLVVVATRELRADDHLALMLASEPGDVLSQLTVAGFPRIIRVATDYLMPLLAPHLDPEFAEQLIELLVRTVISYFLAPSDHVDLGDPDSARAFLRPGLALLTPQPSERTLT
ncbi:MAG: TetR/AcrR family transcriptional regulator [Ilumatobacter fluminis]|uniref:TetR/AcrR family transcriptional regulator n=1 Tax=Ilumatobacter fluminis TaxID=467091 RepID=UPI0032EE70C3